MPLQTGFLLNKRYRIQETIAQGGMGAIYRALDESLNVEVAVKENLFSSEDYSRQFRREATILAGLRHAHLPRVTDHFVIQDQGQYLVMDFIPGEDLRKRIARQGALTEQEALDIGIAISDALAYLHRRDPPILHRDIKPGNIKITPNGQVYLVDFGLAKFAQAGQQTTIGAQSLTPGYAPPEQYGQGTDQRSDIYALAATLYAALTGSVPEDGLSRAMGSSTLTPLRTRSSSISEATAAAIERGMAVDQLKRYPTAEGFRQALQETRARLVKRAGSQQSTTPASQVQPAELSTSPGIEILSPSQPINVKPKAGAGRWLAIGLFVLVIVGGLAGGGVIAKQLLTPYKPPSTPTSTATQAPTTAPSATVADTPTLLPPTPTLKPVVVEVVPTLAPSDTPIPAGTPVGGGKGEIAFASNRSGKLQVFVMGLDGSNVRQVTQMQDGACEPDWSPDGQRIVFVSPCKAKQEQYAGSSLFIINLDGSGLTSLATTPGGDFEPSWSPDGKKILFTSLRDGRPHIYLYTLEDNKVKRLSPQPVYDRQPAWSPDGSQIVFVSSRQGHNQIWIMNADGSSPQEFSLFDAGIASQPAWSKDGQLILFSEGSPQPGIIAKRLDDRINEFPIAPEVRPVYGIKLSPDGAWMIYEGSAEGKTGLFMMTATGTNLTRITDGSTVDIQPSWRP